MYDDDDRLEGASVNKRTKRSLTSNELAFLQTVDDKVEAARLQRTLPTVPRSKPRLEITEENVVCAENATTTCRRSNPGTATPVQVLTCKPTIDPGMQLAPPKSKNVVQTCGLILLCNAYALYDRRLCHLTTTAGTG